MAALKAEHKTLIVTLLATFRTPTEVRKELKERFRIEASLQQIQYYDPRTAQGGRELSAEWRTLFEETRKRYIEGEAEVACSHRRYRLERIQRLLDHDTYSKSPKTVIELLELAAKESGGALTNRRELTGKDGGPIETTAQLDLSQLTDEELETLARLLTKADPDGSGADQA